MYIKVGIPVRMFEGKYAVNPDYIVALRKAGADPVVLLPEDKEGLARKLDGLDGILVPGGTDVDPVLYGEANQGSEGISEIIDALDIDLITLAHARGLPILGVCRGLQVMNVALGGSLFQDIPTMIPEAHAHSHATHLVSIHPASQMAGHFSAEVTVNSYHHQAIKRLSPLLRCVALSDDGIIEAVEGEGLTAVQWHPERMIDRNEQFALFEQFVEACKKP